MNKIDMWLNAILTEDGHKLSAGSLRTIEMIRREFAQQQNNGKPIVSGSLPLTEDDIRFRCTRFAHECRLKGVVTNNDTVELYDKMFGGNNR